MQTIQQSTDDFVSRESIELAHDISLGDLLECESTHDEVISLLSNAVKAMVADYKSLSDKERELSAEVVALNNSVGSLIRRKAFYRVKDRRSLYRDLAS